MNSCWYDIQSAQSMVGKESCNKMALKRCTNSEIRWCRKLTSLDFPVLREIFLPISFNRLLAEELRTPRVSNASTKPQARKLKLNNVNGCDDVSCGVHCVLEGDRIPPLESYGQALEQECRFPVVLCHS